MARTPENDRQDATFWIGWIQRRAGELAADRPAESLQLLNLIFGHGQSLKPSLKRLRDGVPRG